MSDRFHVVDDHCSIAGGEDFGAAPSREEAERIIAERIANGDKGGCRCGGGYLVQTCEERIRVQVGWDERRSKDLQMMRGGLMNLMHYRAKHGVRRDLTDEEKASHKCYDYEPKRFYERLHPEDYS